MGEGYSKKEKDWMGEKIVHYSKNGKKTGETRHEKGILGEKDVNYDSKGHKIGESRHEKTITGERDVHYDENYKRIGTSEKWNTLTGEITKHRNTNYKTVGTSTPKHSVFGDSVVHEGEIFRTRKEQSESTEVPVQEEGDYSSDYSSATTSNRASSLPIILILAVIGIIVIVIVNGQYSKKENNTVNNSLVTERPLVNTNNPKAEKAPAPIVPKIYFSYVESYPMEDRILFDIFVKGGTEDNGDMSADNGIAKYLEAIKRADENNKIVFDRNQRGDYLICEFIPTDIVDAEPEILSKSKDVLGAGTIEEKRVVVRSGKYVLQVYENRKAFNVYVPFSMKKEYEWYDLTYCDFFAAKTVREMDNKNSEKRLKSYFERYYQGAVAIDDEYVYVVFNDLNGPTLAKASLAEISNKDNSVLNELDQVKILNDIDARFIPPGFVPSGRILKMDVDMNQLYIAYRIRPYYEDESYYFDTMHPLLVIAIYDKNTLQLKKFIGGELTNSNLGVRYVTDMKADGKGRFYIASDWDGGRIILYDSSGVIITRIGDNAGIPGEIRRPTLINVDDNENVFVLDSRNKRILKIAVR